MADGFRQQFENKIFFCDVIGYSRLDPLRQHRCQQQLNHAIRRALAACDATLEQDVVALPTGDGVILNFLRPEPDVHLRAAIAVLEALHAADVDQDWRLKIGLNSDVDILVEDINGKKNVVGTGVNTAQRIMDAAAASQILMHGKVARVLSTYAEYVGRIAECGSQRVKHDAVIPISQFLDSNLPFISDAKFWPNADERAVSLDFDGILQQRADAALLTLTLDRRAQHNMGAVRDYIETFCDCRSETQRMKVALAWVVSEMIENAFQHGQLRVEDVVTLRVGKSAIGYIVSVAQPLHDAAALDGLHETRDPDSFLGMMRQRGLSERLQTRNGNLEIELEILEHIGPKPLLILEVDEPARRKTDVPPVFSDVRQAPGAGGHSLSIRTVDWTETHGVLVISPCAARIGEENYDIFGSALTAAILNDGRRPKRLVVDLSDVQYMSSRGLRALTLARREADAQGTEVVLAGPTDRMIEILTIARYDRLFKIYALPEHALQL